MGINRITGEIYIGYREINVKLNRPSHIDFPLYKTSSDEINDFNFNDYDWIIVAEFFTGDDAYDHEQLMIYEEWNNPLLVNRVCYHGKTRFKNRPGYKFTEEDLLNQRLGREKSEEQRVKNLNLYFKNVDKDSPEWVERNRKISEKAKCREWAPGVIENRLKNCLESAAKRKGKPNPTHSAFMSGRPQTPESNKKRSEALSGKRTSKGKCVGRWYLSPWGEEILFYPIKYIAKQFNLDKSRLLRLFKDSTHYYNGWKFIRNATQEEIKDIKVF